MTDLHTHILPGMDDGAPDVATALQMLRMEAEQGVDTVALTPHFYRDREHLSYFLQRRQDSFAQLKEAIGDMTGLPKLILGAEVTYAPGIANWNGLDRLCYEGTRTLLVELPFTPWNDEMFRQLYKLEGRLGITLMIAHADRYFSYQDKRTMIRLLDMDLQLQVGAESLMQFSNRRKGLRLLNSYNGLLISDCHNTTDRSPQMGKALKIAEKKLGKAAADEFAAATDEALTDLVQKEF